MTSESNTQQFVYNEMEKRRLYKSQITAHIAKYKIFTLTVSKDVDYNTYLKEVIKLADTHSLCVIDTNVNGFTIPIQLPESDILLTFWDNDNFIAEGVWYTPALIKNPAIHFLAESTVAVATDEKTYIVRDKKHRAFEPCTLQEWMTHIQQLRNQEIPVMSEKTITITITGTPNCGKSYLAHLLTELLLNHPNTPASVMLKEMPGEEMSDYTRGELAKINPLKDTHVVVVDECCSKPNTDGISGTFVLSDRRG